MHRQFISRTKSRWKSLLFPTTYAAPAAVSELVRPAPEDAAVRELAPQTAVLYEIAEAVEAAPSP